MRLVCALALAMIPAALAAGSLDGARAELRAGRQDKAVEMLRAELVQQPANAEASMLLGQILLFDERFDEAGEVLESALARNPQVSGLHRILGDLRYREALLPEAEKEYKVSIKLDEKNARALYGISRIYEASCLRKKAADLLRVAHAIDFHDPVIRGAFEAADRRSPAAIARMEAELAGDGAKPESPPPARAHQLKVWIAEAKALDGKAPFELAEPPIHYKIPLTALMNGPHRTRGFGLPLRIHDAKTEIFFDTGSPGLLLDGKFAERAGIRRIAETQIYGVGNDEPAPGWIGYAPSLQIGGVEFRNCIVTVREKGSLADSEGLIGSDIFRRFLMKIDFHSKSLDLSPLPGPAWDGVTPVDRYDGPELAGFTQMFIIGHHLLIPTRIGETAQTTETPGLFLFDTGAGMNMISTALAPAITKVHDSPGRVRGLSGKVKMVYAADKVVLQFANFRQENLGLASFDLRGFSRASQAEISGTMGLPLITLFASVTLDYRDGRIQFTYHEP